MSKAYQCDRCDSFASDVPVLTVSMKPGPDNKTSKAREFELCPNCLADLHTFMELEPETGERYA